MSYISYSKNYALATMKYLIFFFFNDTATTEIYTLSLHDALPAPRLPHHVGDVELDRDAGQGTAVQAGGEQQPLHERLQLLRLGHENRHHLSPDLAGHRIGAVLQHREVAPDHRERGPQLVRREVQEGA